MPQSTTLPNKSGHATARLRASALAPPFGSSLPNRTWSDVNREYRYGFNGKEKDSETANDAYDFGARIYDGRLGRWLSLDPQFKSYPGLSSYVYVLNNPNKWIDLNGEWVKDQNGNIIYKITNPNDEYIQNQVYDPNSKTVTIIFFKAQKGAILTDKGNEVVAYKATDKNIYQRVIKVNSYNQQTGKYEVDQTVTQKKEEIYKASPGSLDNSYNCTGNALTNGNFTISSDQITTKVLEDEGMAVVNSKAYKAGDVGMYIGSSGLIHHLEIFKSSTQVNSKGGIEKNNKLINPGTNNYFKVGTKHGLDQINRYTVFRKTKSDTEIFPASFCGPPSPTQIVAEIPIVNTKNGVNTVNNSAFNYIKSKAITRK